MKKASSLWYINEVVDKLRDKEDSDYYIQSLKRHVLNIRNYLNNNISDFKDTGRGLLPVLPDRLPVSVLMRDRRDSFSVLPSEEPYRFVISPTTMCPASGYRQVLPFFC